MVRHGVSECSLTCRSGLALSSRASFWPGVVRNRKPPCNQSNHGPPRLSSPQPHHYTPCRGGRLSPIRYWRGGRADLEINMLPLIVSERGPMNLCAGNGDGGDSAESCCCSARIWGPGLASPFLSTFLPSHTCGVGKMLSLSLPGPDGLSLSSRMCLLLEGLSTRLKTSSLWVGTRKTARTARRYANHRHRDVLTPLPSHPIRWGRAACADRFPPYMGSRECSKQL